MKVLQKGKLRCPTTNKAAFISRKQCLEAVDRLQKYKGWVDEHGGRAKAAYQCPDCHWWHMTKGKNG